MTETIQLTPGVVAAYKEIITDPKRFNMTFSSINDFFIQSEKVTAKHILAQAYIYHINRPLPKVILYIIMDQIYGNCTGKDIHGFAGYHLTFKTS